MIDLKIIELAAYTVGSALPEGAIVRFRAKDSTGFHLGQVGSLPANIGGITLAQTDSAKQPFQKTDKNNGQEYLQFTRANKTSLDLQGLNIDKWAGDTGKTMTVVIILNPTTLTTSKHFAWVKGAAGSFDDSSTMNVYAPYGTGKIVYYDVGSRATGRTNTSGAVSPDPTGHVTSYILERNDKVGKIYQNGVSQPVTLVKLTDATLISGATGGLRLGGSPDHDTENADFDFYELIIYPRALTDAEKVGVNKYTEKVYGTTPHPHPVTPSVKFEVGQGLTVDESGRVAELKDLVGDMVLKQDTVSKQPRLLRNTEIDIPFIRFDATKQSNLFNAAVDIGGWSSTNNKAMTMLIVLSADHLDPQLPFSAQKVVSSSVTTEISLETPDENGRVNITFGNVLAGRTSTTNPIANPTKTLNSFVFHKDGNTMTVYQNGTVIATNTSSSADAPTGSHAVSLGSSADPVEEFMSMDFYELQVYDKALSSSERTRLFNYVNHKYKLA